MIENYQAARNMSKDALSNIEKLPRREFNVKFDDSADPVSMVFLFKNRLYTELDGILHVYL